ncbi:MAG: bifunctional diaminohydroxyphosphoribosylaminopyrimidine deaminase/5-amino-6-(5-phosphoribosylamino)uracil reductase RibD [bacterium]|nr:bifunctional diaminohydroxyphosphoribosylaminopyrimidine deaminase/5-amino-6-(5-phosphoribosylamino)uracil reductase RibD [bacterium]
MTAEGNGRWTARDERCMRAALRLARRGLGRTSPNPAVGALVVRGGAVVGRGWHERAGGPHAEIIALRGAGDRARGATMYVTLEPCCTWGKTPPCTAAIIRAGVRRVVAAAIDPNPRHRGRGIAALRRGGVRVDVGLMGGEATVLNGAFRKFITTGFPFTTVKVAMSLDGKIAAPGGDSRWITGPAARRIAHLLRLRHDAVLVGRGTAERDDPLLTARPPGRAAREPWRIILDSGARIPLRLRVLSPPLAGRTLVAVADRAPRARVARLEAVGARVIRCPSRGGKVSLRALWRRLGRMGIVSLLVEGGGEAIASVLERGLADRMVVFVAPLVIGGRSAPTPVGGRGAPLIARALRLAPLDARRVGGDLMIETGVTGRLRARRE